MSEAVTFVGCGRITRAVVGGLVSAGAAPDMIQGVSRTGAGARALGEEFGIRAGTSVRDAVAGADIVVLAVHPHETPDALRTLADALAGGAPVLVSLVASCRTEAVAAALPGVPVVRAVPNVAVAARHGVTVLSPGPHCPPRALTAAERLFAPLGEVLTAEEDLMETVSALSGAGPALVAHFARALARAGVGQGLSAETAGLLAAHAVRGTGALLTAPGAAPDTVVDQVASPGGMTEAALRTLDDRVLPGTVRQALDAAVRLSLGRLLAGPASPAVRS
ncbi:pyrroline-5-carboxylate reductase family protein [Streptomyces tauricus]|uniref:pyrroline-5-carboxylate reductase family protein n=1 Tax=Streptomyces tauricus TaxID=68274 RepID=UPI002243C0FD|nr:pyrroline-5-carboxylate reductase [Streptomyces tauricus]MCW8101036.1 pyrroline-5-carboxylate reductase [Streptomyces tauricus]